MKAFNLKEEIGSKITPKRMRPWRWTTAASCVPEKVIHTFSDLKKPELGDLVLAQVISVGAHNQLEEASGSRLSIFPGTVFVGVFGNRYAPDQFEGLIPDTLPEDEVIDLLSVGGVLGEVISSNSQIREPTKCKILSFLSNKNGERINTRDFAAFNPPKPNKQSKPRLIIVTGSTMNSGKSNTAKAIVYSLTAAGETVAAGKVTGTAAKKDVLLMRTAGALEVCDFCDFGLPSTYLLSEESLFSLFWRIYDYLSSACGKNGFVVLEFADGIFQKEVELLLSNSDIQSLTSHFVFSCSDSLSAIAGVNRLKNDFGIAVSAISGPSANSPLALKEVRRFLKDIPAFNNMVLDVPTIAQIFAVEKIQTQAKVEVRAESIEVPPETMPIEQK